MIYHNIIKKLKIMIVIAIRSNYSVRKALFRIILRLFLKDCDRIHLDCVDVKCCKFQSLLSGFYSGSLRLLSLHQGWLSLPKRGQNFLNDSCELLWLWAM